MSFTAGLAEGASRLVGRHVSRRSFITRSAMAGSAVVIGAGLDLALKPGTAYGYICQCGNGTCGCGTTCCSGFTEFCCAVNGGYNYCPAGTVMGGWWKADNSSYCGTGPRYYMDCNATCHCQTGEYAGFCSTTCDGLTCACGATGCNSFLVGCLQFRYGQCNQNVPVVGRILCRVVACVPPWEITASCTTASANDTGTAEQDVPCWTDAFPTPPCDSPATNCQTVAMAAIAGSAAGGVVSATGSITNPTTGTPTRTGGRTPVGYGLVTAFGRLFSYGAFPSDGDETGVALDKPVVGMAVTPTGKGYWFVASDGGIFAFGDAQFYGSMGGKPLDKPMVGMAATPSGAGYWTVASDGGIFAFGDAHFYGSMGGKPLDQPIVGMAPSPEGNGYWCVAADGGIFSFDVPFFGSPA